MSLIRLSKSSVGKEEKKALNRVIDAGYLGMGEEVRLFEEELRQFIKTDNEVICVNTGTSALHLALECLGIGRGDEVLVPSLTYVASFQAISATGAKPVACDVTLNHGFIDIKDARNRLSTKTKAIMPVHYGSNSEGMEEIYKFAAEYGLRVVEDAAHSFGCIRGGRRVGDGGDVTCFSFDGIKNITSGEGGAVVTGDVTLANKIKDSRLLGVEKDTEQRYAGGRSWSFDIHNQGWRYHMSNLFAAIGREQLKKIEQFTIHRKECAKIYSNQFQCIDGIKLFDFDYKEITPHIFPILVDSNKRDLIIKKMIQSGIQSGIHYQPNHLLALYKTDYRLPITEEIYAREISLPLHAELSLAEQKRVIDCVIESINK